MKAHLRKVVAVAAVLLAGAWLAAQDEPAALRAQARAALAQVSGEIRLAGLDYPVEVIRDRWGVPHIYAKSVHDLFFAQGFVAAQDRLWQLDLWRRIADGKLSSLLGPSGVTRDTFARLLKYRGDMEAEWRSYRPDAQAIVAAFVEGINAQIDLAISRPGALPIEFQLTETIPERWTPEVVIGRMAGYIMTRNARSEVQRARLAQTAGIDRAGDQMPLDPPVPFSVPEGLDLADITDEILALTAGAAESVDFSPLRPSGPPKTLSADWHPMLPLFPLAPTRTTQPASADVVQAGRVEWPDDPFWQIGSNNWVVAGSLSAAGKPLLANDPHRALLLPSLRYTVHLNGPGWNVIGAGEPALPGVAAGHNERIAFGFTIVGIDQQDVYVERLDPADPDRYLFQGRTEPMQIVRERIEVRGEAPREVTLRFTRHGPVLHRDLARNRAYALRWVGTEPGSAGYLRSLALDTARNWDEFLRAVEGWKVPSENLVYADSDGNIGWVAAGLAPIRPNWNGLLPVPGHEGRYEWQGFLPLRELPQMFNPPSGLLATANHNILPANYRHALGFEFGSPLRFTRILEVLRAAAAGRRRLAVEDFERLQHDELSVAARAVIRALRRALDLRGTAAPLGEEAAAASRMLVGWDGTLASTSAEAALYEAWLPRLTRAVESAAVSTGLRVASGARLTTDRLLRLLAEAGMIDEEAVSTDWVDGSPRPSLKPASLSGEQREQVRRLLVQVLTGSSLEEAWRESVSRMGPDPAAWAWGRVHRARFDHPLAFTPARAEVMNLPEVPRGGDGTTPNATGSGGRQTSGASFREVIDLADWDRSVTINVPGMSGQPESPHYGDLLPLWAAAKYHSLVFSREAVERAAASRLVLVPAR